MRSQHSAQLRFPGFEGTQPAAPSSRGSRVPRTATCDLSIVIVTWNSEEHIGDCLRSVYQNKGALSIEMIVVDNDSRDGTVKLVKTMFADAHLIVNPSNFGFAKATNQGLELAGGKHLLLLNPDTVVQEGALSRMVDFMDDNPTVGSLGPQLLNPDGTVQPSCREFLSHEILVWEFTGLSRLLPHHRRFGRWRMGYFDHGSPREVDQPMGACLMLRRKALEEVGLLDEDFFMFMNDQDLCCRLKDAGWKNYFYPAARVVHHKGASSRKAKASLIASQHRSIYCYLEKHRGGGLLLVFRLLLLWAGIMRFLYYSVTARASHPVRFSS